MTHRIDEGDNLARAAIVCVSAAALSRVPIMGAAAKAISVSFHPRIHVHNLVCESKDTKRNCNCGE